MSATKQYIVLHPFSRVDRKTGNEKRYEPGQSYSGDDIELYLTGVDDKGPLIAEKTSETVEAAAANKES